MQDLASLSDHSGDEIFVTDLAIGTNINFPDPLIKFSGLKLLTDAGVRKRLGWLREEPPNAEPTFKLLTDP